MKRVCKSSPPQALLDFAAERPDATWEQMNDNGIHSGRQAAKECRDRAILDQHGLCAYCETEITSDDPRHRRIEHFHPKSDKAGGHNWGLDWDNMLATCDGGSSSSREEQKMHPLPENLSCDAYKDHMVNNGKLPAACEGYLINPLAMPAFPNLFSLEKGTWRLLPNEAECANVELSENVYETTAELVGNTIVALNLNCRRLTDLRKSLVYDIERRKKKLREKGYKPAEMPEKLALSYFGKKWPKYFTTLRCCLGQAAEDYLNSINYYG